MARPGTSSLHGEARRTGKRPAPSTRGDTGTCVSAPPTSRNGGKWTVPARGPYFGLNASKTCAVVMPSPSTAIHTAGGACASCQRGAMTTTRVSTMMIHERRGSEPYKPGVALAGTP